jgi:hypothetical protein
VTLHNTEENTSLKSAFKNSRSRRYAQTVPVYTPRVFQVNRDDRAILMHMLLGFPESASIVNMHHGSDRHEKSCAEEL